MPAGGSRGPALTAIQTAFLVVAWIATVLRAYVKCAITHRHTVDDGFMYLSTLLYSAYAAAALVGIVRGGIGRHTSDLDSGSIVIALQVWYACEILFAFISATVRTSICLFLLRIFNRGTPQAILRATIVTVWTSSAVYLFIIVFQCSPPSYYWAQFEGTSGSCRPASLVPNATIVHSVVAAASDWVIGILPLSILWKLQMPRAKKVPLVFFFGMGTVAGIIMIVRIPYLKVLEISADFLYQTVDVALLSLVEPSIGIAAGCIATLRPLVAYCGSGKRPGVDPNSSGRMSRVPSDGVCIKREVQVTVSDPLPKASLAGLEGPNSGW